MAFLCQLTSSIIVTLYTSISALQNIHKTMNSLKWFPSSFICLICLTNLVAITKSQFPTPIFTHVKCLNNGSYTSNSTYGRNLRTILSAVSRNIDANGFYNASIGQNPDRVNVIALCRADLQPYQCRNYTQSASTLILENCPGQRQAIFWHEFCMVRYSDAPIYGHVAFSPSDYGHSGENITNPEVFYSELNVLLSSLRDYAAVNSTPKKFAGSGRDVPNFRTVYAFEQCTPDITPDECRDCLTRSAQQIRECCDMARGVRILLPSCYLRFETDPVPFYNASMVEPVSQPPTLPLPPPPQSPQSPAGDDNNTGRTIAIIIVPIVACLVLALCIGIYLKTRKRQKLKEEHELEDGISTVESLHYDFGVIRAATDNFADANKLGQGGFGAVYKGKLPRGNEIAVKRLSKSSEQGDLEFKNEVALLARLQHRNLVRLLGFTVEGNERLLIYEWVQNGSLDGFVFDPNSALMGWEKRYLIIVGVAKGLLYLHEDSRLRIIHRDLKPSNILLDGEMNPKISDFGMARLFVPNESDQHSTSRVVGTYGYMAPEYVIHGQCSTKSDVFSFGILVLEIITGQKIRNFQQGDSTMDDLTTFVWKNWQERTILNIIDPRLRTASGSMHDIMRCIHIGLLCVQDNAADRPTMGSVVLMLSSVSFTMPIPSQPTFFVSRSFQPEVSDNDWNTPSVAYNSSSTHVVSSNEVTMSEIDPR